MGPVRIYLAAHFGRQAAMRERAKRLRSLGYVVTSHWLEEEGPSIPDAPQAAQCAQVDLRDIEDSHLLVFESEDKPRGAGRHVEFGYALARGKALVVVGRRESVFHHLPEVQVVENEEQLVQLLMESFPCK